MLIERNPQKPKILTIQQLVVLVLFLPVFNDTKYGDALDQLARQKEVTLVWVPGHTGVPETKKPMNWPARDLRNPVKVSNHFWEYRGALTMDDPEIQETVESILGKGAKVVDCEKKSSIEEEEMLFINGIPVALEGRDGVAIKQALITVKLDTSLSVKSTTVTKEEVTVSRAGKIVGTKEAEKLKNRIFTRAMTEVFEPIKVIPTSELLNGQYTNVKYAENYEKQPKFYDNNGYETESERKFGSCSSTSSYESEEPPMQAYQPKQCLSKDSGHLSNSMSTTKVDYTPSSIDSLSSLDETDYVANRFKAYEKSIENQSALLDENCTDMSEICPNPAVLAQQLTQAELERLSFIGPEEFVQAFAKENPNLDTSFKDMKKTHNLEQYVQWFNRLSYFVATQVCKVSMNIERYQKKKMRVRVVEYWIETGRECFNIGNFNSLMAIIAGLNMSPISRLKKNGSRKWPHTWKIPAASQKHGPILNENALALASFECEPPDKTRKKRGVRI
ncbi:hypothetical protein NQ317_007164 [Molorchus minor]|uniref:Ras-GEF domain-containing protein n=1 Tax=Molorchus minor TaxID=1323400 RepID=A0ABQ9JZD2_9CUCU|nr:hypothetical protein NQ317_007164 [Molorchus minor]